MPKLFEKGNPGRPKGTKNKEDRNSLKIILQGCFHENRLLIRDTLNSLCVDVRDQVKALNAKVTESTDVSVIKAYGTIREQLLQDFKWLMELKAKMEPRAVELTGKDGEQLQLTPPTIVFTSVVQNKIEESLKKDMVSESR